MESISAYCRAPWRRDVHFSQLFITGYWGSLCGAFLAAFAGYFLFDFLEVIRSSIHDVTQQLGSEKDTLTKLAEKTYFVLFCLLGTIMAWLAIRISTHVSRVPPLALGLISIAFLVPFHVLVAGITQRHEIGPISAFCAFVLLLAPLVGSASRSTVSKPSADGSAKQPAISDAPANAVQNVRWKFGGPDAFVAVVLFLLIFPAHPQDIASDVATGDHPVAFMIGPTLYSFAKGLLPGKDFVALYGHGPSYIFRPFLSTDANAIYMNYVVFLASVLLFFSLTTYFILGDFFGERVTPVVITLVLVVIGNFGTSDWHSGTGAYYSASATPIRYLFIFISAAFGCRLLVNPKGIHLVACGLIIGLSIFWNTETGIYTLVVIHAAYIVTGLADRTLPWRVVILTLSSALSFAFLFVSAFGWAVLDRDLVVSLIEPLRLHAVDNWVSVLMNWAPGWSYFYYTAMPALAIATAVAVFCDWSNTDHSARKERAYLIIFSFLALIFLTKWANRSLDAVWQQSAFAILVVLAWWSRLAIRAAAERIPSQRGVVSLVGVSSLAVIASLWFMQDRGLPDLKVGLRAYLQFPSIASLLWLHRTERPPVRVALDKSDVELVNRYLSPGQPMLLASTYDHLTLISLGRAPKSYFLPITDTFSPEYLLRTFKGADFAFVDKDASFNSTWLADEFRCLLDDFELADRSDRFTVYKRKRADSDCSKKLP